MGTFPNKATQFSSIRQPEKNGRPRKIVTTLNEIGYKPTQINDTILNILALTKDEIKRISDDETCTVLERTVAKAVLNGLQKGSLYNLETIISRAVGKPKETSQVQSDTKIEVVFVDGKTIL